MGDSRVRSWGCRRRCISSLRLRKLHCRNKPCCWCGLCFFNLLSSSSEVFKNPSRKQWVHQANMQVFINMSDSDQTVCNCKCTQGSKQTPMIETTGTICLYLGNAVYPFLPLPFPLPSSSNDFQLSYCPWFHQQISVQQKEVCCYFLCEVSQQLKWNVNHSHAVKLLFPDKEVSWGKHQSQPILLRILFIQLSCY